MPKMTMLEYAKHRGITYSGVQEKIRTRVITSRAIIREDRRVFVISEIADADIAAIPGGEARRMGFNATDPRAIAARKKREAIEQRDSAINSVDEKTETVNTEIVPQPLRTDTAFQVENAKGGGRQKKVIVADDPKDTIVKFREAKLDLEELKARKLKLEIDEMEGKLLDGNQVKQRILKLVSETKSSILNIPSKISSMLVSITDPVEMENKLLAELNEALENLSRLE